MKKYLSVCRVASAEKLLLRLVSRQHFVDGAELYSVEDLVSNRFLKMALFYSKHVFCHLRNRKYSWQISMGLHQHAAFFTTQKFFYQTFFSSGLCAAIWGRLYIWWSRIASRIFVKTNRGCMQTFQLRFLEKKYFVDWRLEPTTFRLAQKYVALLT